MNSGDTVISGDRHFRPPLSPPFSGFRAPVSGFSHPPPHPAACPDPSGFPRLPRRSPTCPGDLSRRSPGAPGRSRKPEDGRRSLPASGGPGRITAVQCPKFTRRSLRRRRVQSPRSTAHDVAGSFKASPPPFQSKIANRQCYSAKWRSAASLRSTSRKCPPPFPPFSPC